MLSEAQAGFRKGYSTIDHIFTLKSLIDIYLHKNKRLYCAFIDYKKAFDSVDRTSLWLKLLSYNINGKTLSIIKTIYENAKSCVRNGNGISDFFSCKIGVRQGDNLSPLLFALFLNDLEEFISNKSNGLSTISELFHDMLDTEEISVFIKLFLLLYADDTVIMSESPDDLQNALNSMCDYCNLWHLQVNTEKTKVVVFSKGKLRKKTIFQFGDKYLETVNEYKYLGLIMNFNGKFNIAVKNLCEQARKAMFSLINKTRKLQLPIDLQLQLFESTIQPILFYGCEIWGSENDNIVESFHLKFLKDMLKLKKCTPSIMVYGELGKTPLSIEIKLRILSYW